MKGTKKVKMNSWKLSIVILTLAMLLLTGAASASMDSKVSGNDQGNDDEQSIVEEKIVGATDDGKDLLVKRVTVHREDSKSKTVQESTAGSGCYSLMGYKWLTLPLRYVINPTNPQGLTQYFITSALSKSSETWDSATSKELFNNAYTIDSTAKYGVFDRKNSLVFGDNYAQSGVIAVTTTWYTLSSKAIVEYDISFETNFAWGNVDQTKMDLQNIATHEIGHGIGLADLYNACTDETMYGYSNYGETKKRDLNAGDKAGLQTLYG